MVLRQSFLFIRTLHKQSDIHIILTLRYFSLKMENNKPECSYGDACFRRNPFHFQQMSHSHLDKLLNEIPSEGDIILPDGAKDKCTNRALLCEQLEILRKIKLKSSSDESGIDPSAGRSSDVNAGRSREETVEPSRVENRERSREVAESTRKSDDENRRKLREIIIRKMRDSGVAQDYVPPMGDFALKWVLAEPYYIFFTAVQQSPETWQQKLSVTLSEILDRSLGEITTSLHLNMVVDFGWLFAQYMLAGQDTKSAKMHVFYGEAVGAENLPKNVAAHHIKCPTSWGSHHAKISVFRYADEGIRIVVSTANLYRDDWDFRTQGLWMSPHLPKLDEKLKVTDGESPTGFKKDFLNFLGAYDRGMNEWKAIVSRADCSAIRVAFVASVPGNYKTDDTRWGHKKLANILRNNVTIPESEASRSIVVAQASSIGSLGANYERSWIVTDIISSMIKTKENCRIGQPNFKFIFPTIENFKTSHDMRECSNALCYTTASHNKQKWIHRYMHKWIADGIKRSRAMPHIKTYTRISSDEKRTYWFVLGSANLSKAAWGQVWSSSYRILSYEANVVFLPKFVTNETDFSIKEDPSRKWPIFPLPYDLPIIPYTEQDKPFVTDFFRDDYEN